jgi:PAS domain S-box-containing protein
MEEQNNLLLQRIAVLRRHLKEEKYLPQSDSLEGIFIDLEVALERAQAANLTLEQQKSAFIHRVEALEQKKSHLQIQTEELERQKENLERLNKTLERHNTILIRQNSQLERHNAAFQERNDSLEFDRNRYKDLFDFAPDAYLITDNSGVILDANRAASDLLHVPQTELKGTNLLLFIEPRDHKIIVSLLTRVRRIQDIEVCLQPRDSATVDSALTLSSFYDETGHPVLLRWLLRDVTERRRAVAALNASERRFRTIFNEANLGILLIDLQNRIVRANRSFQDMLGFAEEELLHRPIADFICADEPPIDQVTLAMRENRQANLSIEVRFRRRDSNTVWTSFALSVLRNDQNQPQYLIAMIQDISLEKQSAVELAEMRRRLLESGEVERLRLAQELHDGPMQDLYGTVFQLSTFSSGNNGEGKSAEIHDLQEKMKSIANTIRVIVGELRPPTIGNLGLERAIRSHADRIAEQHPELEIQLQLTRDGQTLPAHTRLAFFRIYQQCMANILKHAQASQVIITFQMEGPQITMDVWDNGRGFTMPGKWVDLLREGHYGLAGIAERVQALGGKLWIETKPGAGTLIHVTAPKEIE